MARQPIWGEDNQMVSRVMKSWGIVVRRMASDWVMLLAAAVTILIATTLLAAAPIFADAVNLASVRRAIADLPFAEVNLLVTAKAQASSRSSLETLVRDEVADTFDRTGADVLTEVVGDAFEIPTDDPGDDLVNLASVEYIEGIEERATLIGGVWPVNDQTAQLAVQDATAAALGLSVGDTLPLVNRRDDSLVVEARVVGVFAPNDPADPFWYGDPLIGGGAVEGPVFRVHGPFVTTFEGLSRDFTPQSASFSWKVYPRHQALMVEDLGPLRRSLEGMPDRLNVGAGVGVITNADVFSVDSRLGPSLVAAGRSIAVTRANILMLSVQLAVIAGYALMHTSGLLVTGRQVETGLLRSRGAGNGQLLAASVMEGLIITLPAALLAPWLAARVLDVLTRAGPLASIGLGLEPDVNRTAYVLSFLAAGACIVALAVPAYRSARTFNDSYIALGRQGPQGYAQRVGIDIALLVLAGAAIWQLKDRGAELTATVRGRAGVDPLLVAAPALGLLAGGFLALRIVPLVAHLGERIAARRASTVPVLSAWQVARRPLRYTRAALLVTMAVAVGFFTAAYTATWSVSQSDQADFQVGADLTLAPIRRDGAPTDLQLTAAHERVDGVQRSMPMMQARGQLSSTGLPTRLFAIESSAAAEVVNIREDLVGGSFPEMAEVLTQGRPETGAEELPGEPAAVAVTVGMDAQPCLADHGEDPSLILPNEECFVAELSLVLQDGVGSLHRVSLGAIPAEPEARLVAPLVLVSGDRTMTPAYPLSLFALEVGFVSDLPPAPVTLRLGPVEVSDRPEGGDWRSAGIDLAAYPWDDDFQQPVRSSEAASGVELLLDTNGRFGLVSDGDPLPDVFPAIVSASVTEETGIGLGDEIRLSSLRTERDRAVVVGIIDQFPTVSPGNNTVILDLPTLQVMDYQNGREIPSADEYWLDIDEDSSVAGALASPPFGAIRVVDQSERARQLSTDPIALGTIAALALGFLGAAALAAVGFMVSAVASARERVSEFTLLRALGLSRRQLGAWLTVEQAVLALIGVLFGTLIGLLMASMVLPLITVTQAGALTIPELIVTYPLRTILWLDFAVLLALIGVIATLSAVVRRQGVAAQLRIGEG
jgi:ABC-type lipoprotein release transport system permease subunit